MSEWPLVRCLGCHIVVEPTQPACPGCGACLNCGSRRSKKIEQCPRCDVPYCDCCGRCPKCLELRYSDVGPCDCGHPTDEDKLESLVRYTAVIGAEKHPTPIGLMVAFLALIILAVVGLILWLR